MESDLDLAGRVAVVTGGSRGIGAATCRLLAAHGARVACAARDPAAVAALVGEIRASGGQAIGVAADCTRWEAIEDLRAEVERALGPADLLAAFVGGDGARVPVERMSEAAWRGVIDTNLTSAFLTVRSFLPGMILRRRGAIVTMASTAGRQAGGGPGASAAYGAAKAGVIMFTRQTAVEAGPSGVRINCVAPSAIMTEANLRRIPEATRQEMTASFPLRRLGEPDDVARAAVFLLSDASAWITGVALDVTGGRVMA